MTNMGDVGSGYVLGRYELLMPIATGGMAAVWAARLRGSRGFQKIVAIKTILPQLVEDPRFDQMFLDEASLASRIRHPHIVEILDLGEQDGLLYLVMEWVDGEPVSTVLRTAGKSGGVPIPIAVRIVSQACAGLHAAHELRDESGELLGLVHRDVSPQNLLVTFDGVVKVVDFGVAKATQRATGNTNAGQVKGKAAYMSPEQARGHAIDRRTDIFALGIVLYVMTTGRHPFRADNEAATIQNICAASPVDRPSRFSLDYPPALERVVLRALAKDPTHRYATANDMLRALNKCLPEARRVMTDDLVAEYMRNLFANRQDQRRKALKAALRMADERAADRGRTGLSLPIDRVSQLTLTSHSGITRSHQTTIDAQPAGCVGPASASGSIGGTAASSADQGPIDPDVHIFQDGLRRRRGYTLLALGGIVLAGLGAFAMGRTVVRHPEPSRASPQQAAAPSSPLATTTVPPAPPPRASSSEEANSAPITLAPAADPLPARADAGNPVAVNNARSRTSFRQAGTRAGGTAKPPSASTAPVSGTGTTFMSPVRTPGF